MFVLPSPPDDLSALRFTIVTHVYGSGPSFALEDYLRPRVSSLVLIGHPLPFARDTRSFLRAYDHGRLVREKFFRAWKGPALGFYLKDVLLTLAWLLPLPRADVFVGVDVLNATVGTLLRAMRKTRQVIFYTIDYIPERFRSRVGNVPYHWLDRRAVRVCSAVWNLSPVMVTERERRGVQSVYRGKQVVVPVGTTAVRASSTLPSPDRTKIVYLGHLREGQGLELLVTAMETVVAQVPSAHLLCVGGGPLEAAVWVEVTRRNLQRHVQITGFVPDPAEVQRYLADAAVAVAPYPDTPDNYTRYTDPGKVKEYLAHGLPVVITRVPPVADEIAARRCGIAVEARSESLAAALVRLLTDDPFWEECRRNAWDLAGEYAWERIFGRTLEATARVIAGGRGSAGS